MTPRLYVLEMEGAADRARNERALIWYVANRPWMKKPPTYEEFTGQNKNRGSGLRACIAAWDRIDRALTANRKKR